MTDPISDMLTRIKNGYLARKDSVEIPYSRVKENILKALEKKRYIRNIQKTTEENKITITVDLIYEESRPALTEVIRVSKPGLRIYTKKNDIPNVLGGLGTVILSTPKGVMVSDDARKQGLGGEVICKVW